MITALFGVAQAEELAVRRAVWQYPPPLQQ